MFEEITRKQLMKYSCHPKCTQNSAYRHLRLSEDCTKVEWSNQTINYPNGFTDCQQVLCLEHLSKCAYWEVQWKTSNLRDGISIAVANYDLARKGNNCRFGLNNESWCLDFFTQ
ncbi:hypothetical protein AALO_G00123560 [Alosa alosa]|uniref:Uncharacterized protein n=1 Tax=Alosa alosa TaxID=278164 RepID=A0AAV6GLM4_9TELE|nr:hypothetical protein AALO_G00123560 [Alosa alosa]